MQPHICDHTFDHLGLQAYTYTIPITDLHAAAVPEIQGTTQEVALAKVKAAAQALRGPCITEDTALCFKAMNGLPGPFIKYFLKELGHEGKFIPVNSYKVLII